MRSDWLVYSFLFGRTPTAATANRASTSCTTISMTTRERRSVPRDPCARRSRSTLQHLSARRSGAQARCHTTSAICRTCLTMARNHEGAGSLLSAPRPAGRRSPRPAIKVQSPRFRRRAGSRLSLPFSALRRAEAVSIRADSHNRLVLTLSGFLRSHSKSKEGSERPVAG